MNVKDNFKESSMKVDEKYLFARDDENVIGSSSKSVSNHKNKKSSSTGTSPGELAGDKNQADCVIQWENVILF